MNGIAIPTTNYLHLPSTLCPCNVLRVRGLCLEEIPPNALLRKGNLSWRGGFNLGVDLGMSRTGLARSKGFSIRPLKVPIKILCMCLEFFCFKGSGDLGSGAARPKARASILDIAEQQEVDEFIIGLPKSFDGKETPQLNKVHSVAGGFAACAAERGWRVYLQDECRTSAEAMDLMLDMGLSKGACQETIDAYAAMMALERDFSLSGHGIELVLPKQLELQEKL